MPGFRITIQVDAWDPQYYGWETILDTGLKRCDDVAAIVRLLRGTADSLEAGMIVPDDHCGTDEVRTWAAELIRLGAKKQS